MRFVSLKLENFGLFESAELVYPPSGLILVEAINEDSTYASSNLSGKTTLISEALLWGCFGQGTKEKSPEGTTVTEYRVEDVVRRGENNCSVEIEFESAERNYRIRRTRSRSGQSNLELWRQSAPLSAASQKDLQEKINQLLGFSFDSFIHSVLFSQSGRRFTQARDSERKTILDELLNLSIFGLARGQTHKQQLLVENHQAALQGQQTQLEHRLDSLEEQLSEAKAEWSAAKKQYEGWQQAFKQKMKELDAQKASLQKQITQTQKRIRQLRVEDKKLIHKESDIEALKKQLERHSAQLRTIEDEQTRLTAHIEQQKGSQRRLTQLEGGCPTCFRKVSDKHRNKITQELQAKIDRLQAKYGELDEKAAHLENNCDALNKKLQEAVEQIQRSSQIAAEIEHLTDTEQQLEEAVTQLEQRKADATALAPEEPSKKPVQKIQRQIKQATSELEELEKQSKSFEQQKDDLLFLKKAYGNEGIKSRALDSVLPLLNMATNRYASLLTGGEVRVAFDTQSYTSTGKAREQFSVKVLSDGGEGYHLASGGERRRIDFCIALALQALQASRGAHCNLYILDEPFESLDAVGVENTVELLQIFAAENKLACYVVTHRDDLKPYFEKTITIRRRDGKAELIDGG